MRKIHRLAWAAGIIDGEGCISIARRNPVGNNGRGSRSPSYTVNLKIGMVHRPTIEALRETFNVGALYNRPPEKPNHRTQWHWIVSGKDLARVLTMVLPYLIVKKEEADLALFFLQKNVKVNKRWLRAGVSEEIAQFREVCYRRMRELKQVEFLP